MPTVIQPEELSVERRCSKVTQKVSTFDIKTTKHLHDPWPVLWLVNSDMGEMGWAKGRYHQAGGAKPFQSVIGVVDNISLKEPFQPNKIPAEDKHLSCFPRSLKTPRDARGPV